MTKNRLEFLSDGVFAIVMTLLVVEVLIPLASKELAAGYSLADLIHVAPQLFAYFLSFAVLANFWTFHNFLFSIMSKNTTRGLSSLNIILLSFISLIPFSASFLGSYPESSTAISFYSVHILIMAVLFYGIREFIKYSPSVENPDMKEIGITAKDRLYGTARIVLNVIVASLAVIFSGISAPVSIILLIIPVLLGIVPGSLAFLMNITKLDTLAEKEVENK